MTSSLYKLFLFLSFELFILYLERAPWAPFCGGYRRYIRLHYYYYYYYYYYYCYWSVFPFSELLQLLDLEGQLPDDLIGPSSNNASSLSVGVSMGSGNPTNGTNSTSSTVNADAHSDMMQKNKQLSKLLQFPSRTVGSPPTATSTASGNSPKPNQVSGSPVLGGVSTSLPNNLMATSSPSMSMGSMLSHGQTLGVRTMANATSASMANTLVTFSTASFSSSTQLNTSANSPGNIISSANQVMNGPFSINSANNSMGVRNTVTNTSAMTNSQNLLASGTMPQSSQAPMLGNLTSINQQNTLQKVRIYFSILVINMRNCAFSKGYKALLRKIKLHGWRCRF